MSVKRLLDLAAASGEVARGLGRKNRTLRKKKEVKNMEKLFVTRNNQNIFRTGGLIILYSLQHYFLKPPIINESLLNTKRWH